MEDSTFSLFSASHGEQHPAAGGATWHPAMLDAIDYGLLLVDGQGLVMHANRAARERLHTTGDSRRCSDMLPCACSAEVGLLNAAVESAIGRGLRRLITLGHGIAAVAVAVLPLPPGAAMAPAALLVLSRGRVCEPLSVHWYGRSYGLTSTEVTVLTELCRSCTPAEIASARGVSLSTIRSQIATIRAKTGSTSIRDLVSSVARLPPVVCALGVASRNIDDRVPVSAVRVARQPEQPVPA